MVKDEIDGWICHVKSPTEFWLHLRSEKIQLKEMIDEINGTLEDFDHLNTPRKSLFCLAKSKKLGNWQRGKITEVDIEEVKVFFVDYGISETVKASDLKKISNFLTQNPVFALRATLLSIQEPRGGWQKQNIQNFEEKVMNKPVVCRILNTTFPLEVILAVENNVLNVEYSKAGFSSVNIPKPDTLIGEITFISKCGNVYVQLDEDVPKITRVNRMLENAHNFLAPLRIFTDDYVGVKKSNRWHRGLIKKIGPTYLVYLIDIGESLLVERKFIKELPPELIKIEPLVYQFKKYVPMISKLPVDEIINKKVKILLGKQNKIFLGRRELTDHLITIAGNGMNILLFFS